MNGPEEKTEAVQKYMESLYDMTEYELREEIHLLYIRCAMLNSYLGKLDGMLQKWKGTE